LTKLLLATALGLLAVTAPLPAQADGAHYRGECRLESPTYDTTPLGRFGGRHTWNGTIDVLVVANDAGSISATCSIKVNGTSRGVFLVAAVPGTGFVAAAGHARFSAAPTDVVTVCTNVTTRDGYESKCALSDPATPNCPVQVCDDGGLLDQAFALFDTVDGAIKALEPAVCGVLITAAPTVDLLPTAGVLYIDPDTGDTFVGGRTPADVVFDCPPPLAP
jgi:hypothetical protein